MNRICLTIFISIAFRITAMCQSPTIQTEDQMAIQGTALASLEGSIEGEPNRFTNKLLDNELRTTRQMSSRSRRTFYSLDNVAYSSPANHPQFSFYAKDRSSVRWEDSLIDD